MDSLRSTQSHHVVCRKDSGRRKQLMGQVEPACLLEVAYLNQGRVEFNAVPEEGTFVARKAFEAGGSVQRSTYHSDPRTASPDKM